MAFVVGCTTHSDGCLLKATPSLSGYYLGTAGRPFGTGKITKVVWVRISKWGWLWASVGAIDSEWKTLFWGLIWRIIRGRRAAGRLRLVGATFYFSPGSANLSPSVAEHILLYLIFAFLIRRSGLDSEFSFKDLASTIYITMPLRYKDIK